MKIIFSKKYLSKTAASLSRIWQQMLGGSSFGIVSAANDLQKTTPEGLLKNKARDIELRDLLQKFDIGFVRMKGLWKNSELQKYLSENSVFIANAREKDVQAIAELYGQESYVFGNNGFFEVKATNGGMVYLHGKIKDNLRQISSKEFEEMITNPEQAKTPGASIIKGRPWIFEETHKIEEPQHVENR